MERRDRTVIGSYANRSEAMSVVQRLRDEGYSRADITVYTNRDTASRIDEDVNVDTEMTRADEAVEDRSVWEQIKDAFSTDTYDYDTTSTGADYNHEEDILYPYRDDITNGNVVVVVDNYRGEDPDKLGQTGIDTAFPLGNETDADTVGTVDRDVRDDDETIRLKEERLDVDKKEVQTGEVNVRKEVVHDTETVEVPVEREEVVIEKKPVAGERATTDRDFDEDEETISIPVKEERVEVHKEPVVTDEVEIRKEKHTDVERVSEDVRREELDVDADGNTRVDGYDKDLDDTDRPNRP